MVSDRRGDRLGHRVPTLARRRRRSVPVPLVPERSASSKVDHGVNAVRTVAAVLVVLSHARALLFVDFGDVAGPTRCHQLWYLVTGLGHEAVVVFFVLSGYWVGGSVLRAARSGRFDWVTYATARLTRLWLVLVPALVLTAVVDRLGRGLFPASSVYVGSQAYSGVVPAVPSDADGPIVALGNVLFLQGVRLPAFQTNSPLWSLAYEFWYYALFPLVLSLVARGTGRRARSVVGVVLVGACALVGVQVLVMGGVWLLGAGVAELVHRRRGAGSRWVSLPVPVGAVLLGAALLAVKTLPLERWIAVPLVAGGAAALLVSLVAGSARPAGWATRLVSGYAQRSFSLYAIHVPLLAVLAAWWVPDAAHRWQPSGASVCAALGAVAVVCLIAAAFATVTEERTDRVRASLAAIRARRALGG